MKKIITMLSFVLPLLCIGQTQTENYIKTISYQTETSNKRYINDYTIYLDSSDIFWSPSGTQGGASGSIKIKDGVLTFNFSGSWSSSSRLRVGRIKKLNTTPESLPDTELGAIKNSNQEDTGYFAKIEDGYLVFYSPIYVNSVSNVFTTQLEGTTINNYETYFGSDIHKCVPGGGGGSSGRISIKKNKLSIVFSGSWSNCDLKLGEITYINTRPIEDMELGVIKTYDDLKTAYRAKIENNYLIFYYTGNPGSNSINITGVNTLIETNISAPIIYNLELSGSDIIDCSNGGGGGASGELTIQHNRIKLRFSGGWSSTCSLKLGQIKQLSGTQYPIPNTVLGDITDRDGNSTPYGAKIENKYLVFYKKPIIPDPPTNANGNFNVKVGIKDDDKIITVDYANGLGSAKQSIAVRSGGNKEDIILHKAYDQFGRQNKQYLPFASSSSRNGAFYSNSVDRINSFYNTSKYENTTNPYTETVYESSPLNRVFEKGAPGTPWKVNRIKDTDHTTKIVYATNSANSVVNFKVTYQSGDTSFSPTLEKNGFYATSELYKTITKNENWQPGQQYPKNNTIEEFTDKQGQVILTRTYNNNITHDTYYVYDKYGNLIYVIPPKAIISDGVSNGELAELCYQYKYDIKNRLVEKKIPGKGWEYIIYNKLDKPIMFQDSNLRAENKWLFTKYDAFGRVAYTGIFHHQIPGREFWQDFSEDYNIQHESRIYPGEERKGTLMYYTLVAFPQDFLEIHTINYYDDYNFDLSGGDNPNTIYNQAVSNNPKTLPTGSKVRVLGTNEWITTVNYYDNKARLIYSYQKNDYLKTIDHTSYKVDFAGKILEAKTSHKLHTNPALITKDKFTYDHMRRLISQTQKINNQPEEFIVQNEYDELGKLIAKKVGNNLQDVSYKYNIRGWLTQINDPDTLGEDLFAYKINYNDPTGTTTPLYNGNISQTEWKTANDNVKMQYSYTYDALNRITKGIHNSGKYNLTDVNYDKNGNILRLTRTGWQNGVSFANMDRLYYSYDQGNKLSKVVDTGNDNYGFKEGANPDNDYVYDENGNMIKDRNKRITNIQYNHLNLPTKVTFAEVNKYIEYMYTASGIKVSKRVIDQNTTSTTAYAGNYIYKNNELKFFNHPEGYIEPNTTGGFDYIYQYKDHLDNIRLSYSDDNKDGAVTQQEIREENNYYPFGLKHKGYNNVVTGQDHQYGFGGKEEQNELGLDWIDITARNYDPALGRWMNLDPLAEQMRRYSPYNYTFNNPIFFSDPDGKKPKPSTNPIYVYRGSHGQINIKYFTTAERIAANVYKEIATSALGWVGVGLSVIDATSNWRNQSALETTAKVIRPPVSKATSKAFNWFEKGYYNDGYRPTGTLNYGNANRFFLKPLTKGLGYSAAVMEALDSNPTRQETLAKYTVELVKGFSDGRATSNITHESILHTEGLFKDVKEAQRAVGIIYNALDLYLQNFDLTDPDDTVDIYNNAIAPYAGQIVGDYISSFFASDNREYLGRQGQLRLQRDMGRFNKAINRTN
ncbi:DUF6443 domain-containing protein [Aquimarina sp. 2304DJ70-9]|uniref:DUF6443 domain-containing protein n=1 Tax=Aquimarina penaris TaxID=3231044 RepID=UPI00346313D6